MYDRWREKFRGKSARAGLYDVEVQLALRFNWTKTETDAQDPDFIDELLDAIRAEADDQAERAKKSA